MGLVDRVLANTGSARSWPVGKGDLVEWQGPYGHDQSVYSPAEYGDYLVTSNDIYSIVSMRARMMSQLRLCFYSGYGSDKVEMPDSPAAKLYRYVNEFWTSARLMRMDEMCMGVFGETYWAVESENGEPKEIWWLHPERTQPIVHDTKYIGAYAYRSKSGQLITFRPDEIVWHRYPNPLDEFSPLSPLAAARLAADSAKAMMQANNRAFEQGLSIAGLIVPPGQEKVVFSTEQAEELEVALKRKFSGAANSAKWAVLRHEARFMPLQLSQKDAEYIAGLNMTFRMACRAYGMPSALLGDMEHSTLANLREMQRGTWEQTLIPDALLRSQEVEEQYLSMWRKGPDHCEFDTIGVPALQESASEAWVRDAQALDRGLFTINEVRKRIGMPPVQWGDKPYMPANKGPIDDTGVPQLPATDNGKKLPDDQTNPANKPNGPRLFDHLEARAFLGNLKLNGVKL